MPIRGRIICGVATVIIIVAVASLILCNKFLYNKTYNTVIIEAGTKLPNALRFIKNKKESGIVLTKISSADMNKPGVYEIRIKIDKKIYASNLKIVDTIAPVAEIENQDVWVNQEKGAKEFVKNISDATRVNISFSKKPDFSKIGLQEVLIILEDTSGNKTELETTINVREDNEPPRIDGVHDQIVYIDDKVSYKRNITVQDNCDKDLDLMVDSTEVNIKKIGSYDVIYSAVDSSGNTTTKKCTYKVIERPIYNISKAELDELADKKLASIIKQSMFPMEKARKIYNWTRSHIRYVNHSDKSDPDKAAYQGMVKGSGDCFVYFATAQELLTRAGIPNQGIVKLGGGHYWSLVNCGTGWYHFDTTPRRTGGIFFMLTDAEIEEYSRKNNNSHVWDRTKYPATPLTSASNT